MTQQNELKVISKSVYGNTLIYPHCEKSLLFAALLKTKTLTNEALNGIKKLGYSVTIINSIPL